MKIGDVLIRLGLVAVITSVVGILIIISPVLKEEVKYATKKEGPTQIVAVDKDFSIVVPKIGANSKVIKDVDPFNQAEYVRRLAEGVAHAEGTSLPGQDGNAFFFAHSTDNFYNANRYNSVFYLLNKMETGDNFFLVYENEVFEYVVTETKRVGKEAVEYLEGDDTKSTATLMTCWPPGTTFERLLVIGELVEN